MGQIYKITNKINGKSYIGQTSKTAKERWKRHLNDAYSGANLNISKAIRKYGPDSFELTILAEASTKEELNFLEYLYIKEYDTIKTGYNMKDGGDCYNTYAFKSPEEMLEIKEKIRLSKLGGANPHSTRVKCLNVDTGQILHFSSMKECAVYFNENNEVKVDNILYESFTHAEKSLGLYKGVIQKKGINLVTPLNIKTIILKFSVKFYFLT